MSGPFHIRARGRATADPHPRAEARDIRLLQALADEQLRYGQSEEALILLHLCQHLEPNHPDTILRLARTFAALEEWDAAQVMMDALGRTAPAGGARNAAVALLRAAVAFGGRRIAEARAAFAEFMAAGTRETAS